MKGGAFEGNLGTGMPVRWWGWVCRCWNQNEKGRRGDGGTCMQSHIRAPRGRE